MSSPSRVMPALLTSTSTGPWCSSTSVKARSTAAASVTSHCTPNRPSGAPLPRWVTATASPCSANARAIASPIPRFPPVTSTDLATAHSLPRCAPRLSAPVAGGSGVLEPEADLHADLEVLHGAVDELPPYLRHLEPVQVTQRFSRTCDTVADRRVDAFGGRPDDLGDPVRAIHLSSSSLVGCRLTHALAAAAEG